MFFSAFFFSFSKNSVLLLLVNRQAFLADYSTFPERPATFKNLKTLMTALSYC